MRTPPPLLPASQLIIGTSIEQLQTPLMSSPSQVTIHKTRIQKAQESLDSTQKYLNDSHQGVGEKIKKGADPKTLVVNMPYSTFEEIGKNVTDAKHHLSHHATHSEEIEERLDRFEKIIKETMASTMKTWAQVAAAPAPEPDRIREIQERNLERKVQQRNE